MNTNKISFYFDYLSPWAYFAWQPIKALARKRGLTLELNPIPYPNLSASWQQRAVATLPPKREFIFKFAYRYAKKHGIPYNMPQPHPYKPYTSLRLSLAEVCGKRQQELVDLLFEACWVKGVDMGSDTALTEFLTANNFPGQKWVEQTKAASIKKTLIENTEKSINQGIFGVPTMVIDDELFWGNDQIEFINDYLNGKDPCANIDIKGQLKHSWGLTHK